MTERRLSFAKYILCDGTWHVLSAVIVREPAAGRLPSDHFPVVADLTLAVPDEPGP